MLNALRSGYGIQCSVRNDCAVEVEVDVGGILDLRAKSKGWLWTNHINDLAMAGWLIAVAIWQVDVIEAELNHISRKDGWLNRMSAVELAECSQVHVAI